MGVLSLVRESERKYRVWVSCLLFVEVLATLKFLEVK
jgi:hypothetical protein